MTSSSPGTFTDPLHVTSLPSPPPTSSPPPRTSSPPPKPYSPSPPPLLDFSQVSPSPHASPAPPSPAPPSPAPSPARTCSSTASLLPSTTTTSPPSLSPLTLSSFATSPFPKKLSNYIITRVSCDYTWLALVSKKHKLSLYSLRRHAFASYKANHVLAVHWLRVPDDTHAAHDTHGTGTHGYVYVSDDFTVTVSLLVADHETLCTRKLYATSAAWAMDTAVGVFAREAKRVGGDVGGEEEDGGGGGGKQVSMLQLTLRSFDVLRYVGEVLSVDVPRSAYATAALPAGDKLPYCLRPVQGEPNSVIILGAVPLFVLKLSVVRVEQRYHVRATHCSSMLAPLVALSVPAQEPAFVSVVAKPLYVFGLTASGLVCVWDSDGSVQLTLALASDAPPVFDRLLVAPQLDQLAVTTEQGDLFLLHLHLDIPSVMSSSARMHVDAPLLAPQAELLSRGRAPHQIVRLPASRPLPPPPIAPREDDDSLVEKFLFSTLRARHKQYRRAAARVRRLTYKRANSNVPAQVDLAARPVATPGVVATSVTQLVTGAQPGARVALVWFSSYGLHFTTTPADEQPSKAGFAERLRHARKPAPATLWSTAGTVFYVPRCDNGAAAAAKVCTIRMPTDEQSLVPLVCDGERFLHRAPHLWSPTSIHMLVPSQTPREILRHLLIFDARKQDSPTPLLNLGRLCACNGWDLHEARIEALKIGLRFRELPVIEHSLEDLQSVDPEFPSNEEQELLGCQLLMEHISSNALLSKQPDMSAVSSMWQYYHALLQVGVEYVASLIKRHSEELLHGQLHFSSGNAAAEADVMAITDAVSRRLHQPSASIDSPDNSTPLVDVILRLSANLDKLRTLQSQLLLHSRKHTEKAVARHRQDAQQGFAPPSAPKETTVDDLDLHPTRQPPTTARRGSLAAAKSQAQAQPPLDDAAPRLLPPREVEAIVKAALVHGRISQVIAELRPHLHFLYQAELDKLEANAAKKKKKKRKAAKLALARRSRLALTGTVPLRFLRQTAGRVVYDMLRHEQMDYLTAASRLLSFYGEDVTAFMRHIAFNTSRRSLRSKLILHLSHVSTSDGRRALSPEDLELIRLLKELERLFPNPSYSTVANRMWTRQLRLVHERKPDTTTRDADEPVDDEWVADDLPPAWHLADSADPFEPLQMVRRCGSIPSTLPTWQVYTALPSHLTQVPEESTNLLNKPRKKRRQKRTHNKPTDGETSHVRMPSLFDRMADDFSDPDSSDAGDDIYKPSSDEEDDDAEGSAASPRSSPPKTSTASASSGTSSPSKRRVRRRRRRQGRRDEPDSEPTTGEVDLEGDADQRMLPRRYRQRSSSGVALSPQTVFLPEQPRDSFGILLGDTRERTLSTLLFGRGQRHGLLRVFWRHGDMDDLTGLPLGLTAFHSAGGVDHSPTANKNSISSVLPPASPAGKPALPNFCVQCNDMGHLDEVALPHADEEDDRYLHITLRWLSQWPKHTLYRVLLERGCPDMLAELARDDVLGVAEAKLAYAIAHNDWEALLLWVDRIPLHDGFVVSTGHLRVAASSDNVLLTNIYELVSRHLHKTTAFTRELLLNELARRGIFLPEEHRLPHARHLDDSSTSAALSVAGPGAAFGKAALHDFTALMHRLARANRLFHPWAAQSDEHEDEDGDRMHCVDMSRFLPTDAISPFHLFFLCYCVYQDLPGVFEAYARHYRLPLARISGMLPLYESMSALQKLRQEHDLAQSAAQALRYSPWFDVFLHLQLDDLYAAALVNASISVKGPRQTGSVTIQSIFARNKPLLALSVCAFAPASTLAKPVPLSPATVHSDNVHRSIHEPRGKAMLSREPYVLHLRLAKQYLAAFAELHLACFPPSPEFPVLTGPDAAVFSKQPEPDPVQPATDASPVKQKKKRRPKKAKKADASPRKSESPRKPAAPSPRTDSVASRKAELLDRARRLTAELRGQVQRGKGAATPASVEPVAVEEETPMSDPETDDEAKRSEVDEDSDDGYLSEDATSEEGDDEQAPEPRKPVELQRSDLEFDVGRAELLQGNIFSWYMDVSLFELLADMSWSRRRGGVSVRTGVNVDLALNNPLFTHNVCRITTPSPDAEAHPLVLRREAEARALHEQLDPKFDSDPTETSYLYFSHPLVSRHAPTYELDYAYFLRKGQPLEAFRSLSSAEAKSQDEDTPLPVHLWPHRVYQTAVLTALRGMPDVRVERGCIVFVQLCALDTLPLRTLMEAAKRVFNYRRYCVLTSEPEDALYAESPDETLEHVCGVFSALVPLCLPHQLLEDLDAVATAEGATHDILGTSRSRSSKGTQLEPELVAQAQEHVRARREAATTAPVATSLLSRATAFLKRKLRAITAALVQQKQADGEDSSGVELPHMDVWLSHRVMRLVFQLDEGEFKDMRVEERLDCDSDFVASFGPDVGVACPTPFITKASLQWDADEHLSEQHAELVMRMQEEKEESTDVVRPWHLLVRFQLLFQQPVTISNLAPLAQPGHWLRLLLDAQRLHLPAHELVRVVTRYLKPGFARDALAAFARTVLTLYGPSLVIPVPAPLREPSEVELVSRAGYEDVDLLFLLVQMQLPEDLSEDEPASPHGAPAPGFWNDHWLTRATKAITEAGNTPAQGEGRKHRPASRALRLARSISAGRGDVNRVDAVCIGRRLLALAAATSSPLLAIAATAFVDRSSWRFSASWHGAMEAARAEVEEEEDEEEEEEEVVPEPSPSPTLEDIQATPAELFGGDDTVVEEEDEEEEEEEEKDDPTPEQDMTTLELNLEVSSDEESESVGKPTRGRRRRQHGSGLGASKVQLPKLSLLDCFLSWTEAQLGRLLHTSGSVHEGEQLAPWKRCVERMRDVGYPHCVGVYLRQFGLDFDAVQLLQHSLEVFFPHALHTDEAVVVAKNALHHVPKVSAPTGKVTKRARQQHETAQLRLKSARRRVDRAQRQAELTGPNPLLQLVTFSQAAVGFDFEASESALGEFVGSLRTLSKALSLSKMSSEERVVKDAAAFLDSTAAYAAAQVERLHLLFAPPLSMNVRGDADEPAADAPASDRGRLLHLLKLAEALSATQFFALYDELLEMCYAVPGLQLSDDLSASWISCMNTCRSSLKQVLSVAAAHRASRLQALVTLLDALIDRMNGISRVTSASVVREARETMEELRELPFLWSLATERLKLWRETRQRFSDAKVSPVAQRSFYIEALEAVSASTTADVVDLADAEAEREALLSYLESCESSLDRRDDTLHGGTAVKDEPRAASRFAAVLGDHAEADLSALAPQPAEADGTAPSSRFAWGTDPSATPTAPETQLSVVSPETVIQQLAGSMVPANTIETSDQDMRDLLLRPVLSLVDVVDELGESENEDAERESEDDEPEAPQSAWAEPAAAATDVRVQMDKDFQRRIEQTVSRILAPALETAKDPEGDEDGATDGRSTALFLTGNLRVVDLLVGRVMGANLEEARAIVRRYRLADYGYESCDLALVDLCQVVADTPLGYRLPKKLPRAAVQLVTRMRPEVFREASGVSGPLKPGNVNLDAIDRSVLLATAAECAVSTAARVHCEQICVEHDVGKFLHWPYRRVRETPTHVLVKAILREEKQRQRAAFHRRQAERRTQHPQLGETEEVVEEGSPVSIMCSALGLSTTSSAPPEPSPVPSVSGSMSARSHRLRKRTPLSTPRSARAERRARKVSTPRSARRSGADEQPWYLSVTEHDLMLSDPEFEQRLPVEKAGELSMSFRSFDLVQRLVRYRESTVALSSRGEQPAELPREPMPRLGLNVVANFFFAGYCESDSVQHARVPEVTDLVWLLAFARVPRLSEAQRLRFCAELSSVFFRMYLSTVSVSSRQASALVPTTMPLAKVALMREVHALLLSYYTALHGGDWAQLRTVVDAIVERLPVYVQLAISNASSVFERTPVVAPAFEVLRRLCVTVLCDLPRAYKVLFDYTVGGKSTAAEPLVAYDGAGNREDAPAESSSPSWEVLSRLLDLLPVGKRGVLHELLMEYLAEWPGTEQQLRPVCTAFDVPESVGFFLLRHAERLMESGMESVDLAGLRTLLVKAGHQFCLGDFFQHAKRCERLLLEVDREEVRRLQGDGEDEEEEEEQETVRPRPVEAVAVEPSAAEPSAAPAAVSSRRRVRRRRQRVVSAKIVDRVEE